MSAAGSVRTYFSQRKQAMGAGVLVLVALAFGRVITDHLPDPSSTAVKPFERHVGLGETAHLRIGDLKVTAVEGGKTWAGPTEAKLTDGVWVVPTLEMLPNQEDSAISYAAIRDSEGHVWERGRGKTMCALAVAGVPMSCKVSIEIPAQPLKGAELVLAYDDGDDRYDDRAVIPLTIDAATIEKWSAATEPITMPFATIGDAS